MKSIVNDFLYYTKSERNGAIGMVILCIGIICFPTLYAQFFSFPSTSNENYQAEIVAFRNAQHTKQQENTNKHGLEKAVKMFDFDPNSVSESALLELGLQAKTVKTILNYRNKGGKFLAARDFKKIYGLSAKDYERLLPYIKVKQYDKPAQAKASRTIEYEGFPFDPNTASAADLERLGLSSKTAKTIINYRGKGGKFETKEDLKKIYTLSEKDYERLEEYIQISLQKAAQDEKQLAFREATTRRLPDSYEPSIPRIDINQSTAEQWQQLRGVGPGYSRRITQFRIALGGFHSIEQVRETYGLPDSVFQEIKPFLTESPILTLLPINTIAEEELSKHPYVSWKEAKLLIKYRAQHGAYKSIDDVKKIRALKEESITRFALYLSFLD